MHYTTDEIAQAEREIKAAFKWPRRIVFAAAIILLGFATWMMQGCASKGYRATEYRTDGSVASHVEFSTSTLIYGPTLQDVTATDGNRTVRIGSEQSDAAKAMGLSETIFKTLIPLLAPNAAAAPAAAGMVAP